MSMLGIRQIAVCVNKMDLAGYRQDAFEAIREEYGRVPGASRHGAAWPSSRSAPAKGDNVARSARSRMPWYDGPTILEMLDRLEKEPSPVDKPLRLPVQDVYKFTEQGDDRRIVAGRIETGRVRVGDEVVFLPSGKAVARHERRGSSPSCRRASEAAGRASAPA